MNKNYFFAACFYTLQFFSGTTYAQPLAKQWDYRYGGISNEKANVLLKTGDGGYLLGGYTESDANGDISQVTKGSFDFWVVKLDAGGIMQWNKRYGGTEAEVLTAIVKSDDGGYLLGGFSTSDVSGDKTEPSWGFSDYWIVKIDSAGAILWDKRYGSLIDDNLTAMCKTSDGGYLLGGHSNSPVAGDKSEPAWFPFTIDYWVVKIDAFGNKQWDKRFGGYDVETLNALSQTQDNGFLIAGFSNSDTSGNVTQQTRGGYDYWIVKTDSSGNLQWERRFGGEQDDMLISFTDAGNGALMLAGWSYSSAVGDKSQFNNGSSDYWLVKTDANGNKLWDKVYGGSNTEDDMGNIIKTGDGGYMIPVTAYSATSGDKTEGNLGIEQIWLIKTDTAGVIQWDKTIFTTGHEEGTFIVEDDEYCYTLLSRSNADVGGYKTQPAWDTAAQPNTLYDFWIAKFCDSTIINGVSEATAANEFTIYPNPFTEELTISNTPFEGPMEIKVYDVLGRTIFTRKYFLAGNKIKTGKWKKGIYFIEITGSGKKRIKKVVKM